LKADRASSLCWLAVGGISIYGSIHLGLGTLGEPGSGFLSFLAGCFICLMALIIFLRALIRDRGLQVKTSLLWEGTNWRRPIAIGLLTLGYILALERIGFLLTSFLLLLVIFRGVEKLSWRKSLLIPVSTLGLSYLLFHIFLKAALPRGVLGF